MASRFLRSYDFWLGMLMPAVLLWAWGLSGFYRAEVFLDGPRGVRIDHRDGYLRLTVWRDPEAAKWEAPAFEDVPRDGHFIPVEAWCWQWDRDFVDIQISHWMVLVSYAAVFWVLRQWHRRGYRIENPLQPDA